MTIRAGVIIRIRLQAIDTPAVLVNMPAHTRIIIVVLYAAVDAMAILISMIDTEAPRRTEGCGAGRGFVSIA